MIDDELDRRDASLLVALHERDPEPTMNRADPGRVDLARELAEACGQRVELHVQPQKLATRIAPLLEPVRIHLARLQVLGIGLYGGEQSRFVGHAYSVWTVPQRPSSTASSAAVAASTPLASS